MQNDWGNKDSGTKAERGDNWEILYNENRDNEDDINNNGDNKMNNWENKIKKSWELQGLW